MKKTILAFLLLSGAAQQSITAGGAQEEKLMRDKKRTLDAKFRKQCFDKRTKLTDGIKSKKNKTGTKTQSAVIILKNQDINLQA